MNMKCYEYTLNKFDGRNQRDFLEIIEGFSFIQRIGDVERLFLSDPSLIDPEVKKEIEKQREIEGLSNAKPGRTKDVFMTDKGELISEEDEA